MERVTRWRHASAASPSVHLSAALDCTTAPSSTRASFPYDITPPLRILQTSDILRELVHVPDFQTTVFSSFAFGALTAFLLPKGGQVSRLPRLLRLLLSLLSMVVFARFARGRTPVAKDVSSLANVSSSPHGPCRLVAKVLTLSNSHAGTHADTPRHFHINGAEADFPAACYTGLCHVVDLSALLPAAGSGQPRAITKELLQAAEAQGGFLWRDVWRVLFVTRRYSEEPAGPAGDAWDAEFAHFDPAGAEFLATKAAQLLLVGLDTPSVDHPTQSPICHGAHGALYAQRIAILENLDLRAAQRHILATEEASRPVGEAARSAGAPNKAAVQGTIMTVFIPAQCFPDSKGCAVVFFPDTASPALE